ncbi:hypothetical protein DERP_008989 [Dermatophagoides pteronyssinus]|uniref:Serine/threonine-protein kinase DDB_G0282963 n=1 Tax=Dermatophagoides pteronyssinus TaxID=6956 RepID=A0ABQ8JG62_DERPT|nr:hypothetical protein DERP_008989 [Dermatophagoides pteronyssinus]
MATTTTTTTTSTSQYFEFSYESPNHHHHRSIINESTAIDNCDNVNNSNSNTRAPLLETISILASSSSFIYSYRSSSSSSSLRSLQSPTSELSDNHNDNDNVVIDDTIINVDETIKTDNESSDLVRFSNEVQISKHNNNNNTIDSDPLINIYQTTNNHDHQLPTTQQTCSSSSNSTLNSTNQSIDTISSVVDINPSTSSYVNISTSQSKHKNSIQQWNTTTAFTSTRPTTTTTSSNINGFKSILKDPLCAKLRHHSIHQLFYGSIDSHNNNNNNSNNILITKPKEQSFLSSIMIDNDDDNDVKFSNKIQKSIKQLNQNDSNRISCFNYKQKIDQQSIKLNKNTLNNYHSNIKQQELKTTNTKSRTTMKISKNQNNRQSSSSLNINRPFIMSSLNNDYRIEPTISNIPTITNMIMSNRNSLDQWLATLEQESKNNNKILISDDSKQNESKSISNESINSTNQTKFRQEELYTLLSDPIKGPSINRLMDQLSNWSDSFDNGQTKIDSTNSTNNISDISNNNNNNLTAKILKNTNNNLQINQQLSNNNEPISILLSSTNRSTSPSLSSCSTNQTTRSRSTMATVDNHIYEEILYESFQQQQQQQNHL